MALGYETYNDERDFEQVGLTGEVSKYAIADMKYPCFIITSKIPQYKAQVINTMTHSVNVEKFDEEILNSRVHIYIIFEDKTYCLGQIFSKQVKSFISLCKDENVYGYLDGKTKLEGMYLYALAT